MKLGNIDAKFIALLEYLLPSLVNESIKTFCEAGHPLTQVLEAKIDVG